MRIARSYCQWICNFSAHELAVKEQREPALSNGEIEWCPSNTTSHWQPLESGPRHHHILQALASQDVDHIYDQAIDKEKDSLKTGTLLEANIIIGQRKLGIRPSRSGVGGNLQLSSESH